MKPLKEGEVLCPDCKGSSNQAQWDIMPDYRVYFECKTCNGEGKLDWIEAIVGKKKDKIKMNIKYGQFGIKNPNTLIGSCVS